jgi:glycosyltransferase involved in cell wall biosynthesis
VAAKGVITGPDQLHVCYCHSPVRFAWDLQHQYLREAGIGFGPKGLLTRAVLHYLRNWDARSSLGVDQFIANSEFVARRIQKVYRREAAVVHPPVNTTEFSSRRISDRSLDTDQLNTPSPNDSGKEDFYLVAGRMVPYKRTDLIVSAFAGMPDRKLVVIGEGPDFEKVKKIATPNVTLLGFQDQQTLIDHMQRARALVFAAEEDFGIIPVEALASGTPVIAYGKGGVTESVVDGLHGVHYLQQTEADLVEAIERFEERSCEGNFDPDLLKRRSLDFSNERFADEIQAKVLGWLPEPMRHDRHRDRQAVIRSRGHAITSQTSPATMR